MEYYNIRVTNTTKLVLAMILPPLLIVPVIVLMAVKLPNLSDWAVGSMITVAMVLIVVLAIYIVKRASPFATLTLHSDGFSVDFANKDIFTPSSFSIKITDIINMSAEGKDGLYYLSFTTTATPDKFNIEAPGKKEEELESFKQLMARIAQMVVDNNERTEITDSVASTTTGTAQPHIITSVTMYESWWAKLISVFAILIFILMIGMLMFAPDKAPDSWRLAPMVIFGVPFIYKVWYHNYRKKRA